MEYFSLLDFRGRLRVVTTARLRSSTPQGDAEGESYGCWSLEQVVITWSCTRWNEKDTLDILRLSLVNVSSDNCQNRTWFLERLRKLNGDNRRQHDYLFNVLSPCTTKNKLPYHIIRLSILNALRMRNGENFENYSKKVFLTSRWTDNVFALRPWCRNKFNIEESQFNKQFEIPDDFDYIDSWDLSENDFRTL